MQTSINICGQNEQRFKLYLLFWFHGYLCSAYDYQDPYWQVKVEEKEFLYGRA